MVMIASSQSVMDEEIEEKILNILKPELNYICYNSTRACILHLLIKNKDLNHALCVEEISRKLGKRHSVVIHHLEKLSEWKLVEVIKLSKYGNKEKRKIWGLNLKYKNIIINVYNHLLKNFYNVNELEKMCCVNKNIRIVENKNNKNGSA